MLDPNPFTNTFPFPIAVGDVICVDGAFDIVSHFPCVIESQFLADGIPLTNPFPACPQGGLTPELAQYLVNAYKVNPNSNITANNLGDIGTQVIITTVGRSYTTAQLQVFVTDTPFFMFQAPFVCTKSRIGAYPIICLPESKVPGCPTFILVGPSNRRYKFLNKDGNGNCCYQLIGSRKR